MGSPRTDPHKSRQGAGRARLGRKLGAGALATLGCSSSAGSEGGDPANPPTKRVLTHVNLGGLRQTHRFPEVLFKTNGWKSVFGSAIGGRAESGP